MRVTKLAFCTFVFFFLRVSSVYCKDDVSEAFDIQEFLLLGESQLVVPQQKDVVLVLGNTGAGKSTFTQWIAGDDSKVSKLISVEVGEETGEYIIVDNNRISNLSTRSMTVYPELIVDEQTNTSYYDISGFSDTRGIKNDLSTSYFIKRVVDRVENIKILLVVSYPSVRKGVDRLDFKRLLLHFTELVRNIDKYLDGIGLIVTKVDNILKRKSKGRYELVSDAALTENVANFLLDVKEDLEEMDTDKNYSEDSIKLIDALLSSSEQSSYPKIKLFRRPDASGPLNEIPSLQEAKQNIRTLVENLCFIPKDSKDFRYTVSGETKNKIHSIVNEIQISLENAITYLANDVEEHFNKTVINALFKIQNEFKMDDTGKTDSDLVALQCIAVEVNKGYMELVNLQSKLSLVKRASDISKSIKNTYINLNLDINEQIETKIISFNKFLDFIIDTKTLKFNLNTDIFRQTRPFLNAGISLEKSSEHLNNSIEQFSNNYVEFMKLKIKTALVKLEDEYTTQEKENKNINKLHEILTECQNQLKEILKTDKNKPYSIRVQKFNQTISSHNIVLSDHTLKKLEDQRYYNFLTEEIGYIVSKLSDSIKWYKFLDNFYSELLSYNMQNDEGLKKRFIDLTENTVTYVGRKIYDTNIPFLLRDSNSKLYNTVYENIKNINLTQLNVNMLKDVVRLALSEDDFVQTCTFSDVSKKYNLLVKARIVKLSDVSKTCAPVGYIKVFGQEQVFIDTDWDFTGQNVKVTIIAPRWEIIGKRKIILDGLRGQDIQPTKAEIEQNGEPGLPGGNGGYFSGFGDTFVHGYNLFISANGGDGGRGQDGGDGIPGQDGTVPKIKYSSFTYNWPSKEPDYNVQDWRDQGFLVGWSEERTIAIGKKQIDFIVAAPVCTDGSDAGCGGVGGKGGVAGSVEVFKSNPFKVSVVDGANGAAGFHGNPGTAGEKSGTINVLQEWIFGFPIEKTMNITSTSIHTCKNGKVRNIPDVPKGTEKPSPKDTLSTWAILNDYELYLKTNLDKTVRQNTLTDFLKLLHEIHHS